MWRKKGLPDGLKHIINDTQHKTREEAEDVMLPLPAGCMERASALENLQQGPQQLTLDMDVIVKKYGTIYDA